MGFSVSEKRYITKLITKCPRDMSTFIDVTVRFQTVVYEVLVLLYIFVCMNTFMFLTLDSKCCKNVYWHAVNLTDVCHHKTNRVSLVTTHHKYPCFCFGEIKRYIPISVNIPHCGERSVLFVTVSNWWFACCVLHGTKRYFIVIASCMCIFCLFIQIYVLFCIYDIYSLRRFTKIGI